jgi:hypothetical protein
LLEYVNEFCELKNVRLGEARLYKDFHEGKEGIAFFYGDNNNLTRDQIRDNTLIAYIENHRKKEAS